VAVKKISSFEDALNQCRDLGMRMSRQRRFILELLWQVREHLSAREIYDRLNREGKAIGHTSVYQNLEALSAQGIIECIERSDGRLYGNISDSHSHINCINTGQLLDIYVTLPEELIEQVEKQTGVRITDYRIDFYGYRLSGAEASGHLAVIKSQDLSASSYLDPNGDPLRSKSSPQPMAPIPAWSEDDTQESSALRLDF
jgi:Fur family transcriptional regulator, ferric uptake regulator